MHVNWYTIFLCSWMCVDLVQRVVYVLVIIVLIMHVYCYSLDHVL
jgi:hypothetical protein